MVFTNRIYKTGNTQGGILTESIKKLKAFHILSNVKKQKIFMVFCIQFFITFYFVPPFCRREEMQYLFISNNRINKMAFSTNKSNRIRLKSPAYQHKRARKPISVYYCWKSSKRDASNFFRKHNSSKETPTEKNCGNIAS